MDEFAREALAERQAWVAARQRVFWVHAVLWLTVNLLLVVIWAVTGGGFPWFVFPLLGWLIGLAAHGGSVFLLRSPQDLMLNREADRPEL
jgi:hypothetical protein